jgi:hypothetical protein
MREPILLQRKNRIVIEGSEMNTFFRFLCLSNVLCNKTKQRPQSSSSRGKSPSSSSSDRKKQPKETFQSHVKRCSSLRGISNSFSEMDISQVILSSPNNNNKNSSSQFSLEKVLGAKTNESYPSILRTPGRTETAFASSSSNNGLSSSTPLHRKDSMRRRSFILPPSSSSSHVTVVSTSVDHHNHNHLLLHQNPHPVVIPGGAGVSFHSIRLRRYASDESLPSDSGCGSSTY